MKILVVGASGMIGSTILRVLSEDSKNQVFGSLRDASLFECFEPTLQSQLIKIEDIMRPETLAMLIYKVMPEIVINCAGLTKHKPGAEDPFLAIPVNSLLPHHLAYFCKSIGARLIQVSTDCVFSGETGNYREADFPDAHDVYGKSKILGELYYPKTITLRTSTIGHELQSNFGLLDWFLSQGKSCKGFAQAIFSGLPTVVFARVIRDFVIPNDELFGLYHIASKPINKYKLLSLIAEVYQKDIEIIEDDSFRIDRSLNSDRFKFATGYEVPEWPELIKLMHEYR